MIRIDVLTLDLAQAREELVQAKKRITELELLLMLGAKICKNGEQPVITVGGIGYRFPDNRSNRPKELR
jgi:hypothetical protein